MSLSSEQLAQLRTEQGNPDFPHLDAMSTTDLVRAMNENDSQVPTAVAKASPSIERAIDAIVARMQSGGRLIYIGAGTSGRLGVLDAAECVPTFSVLPGQVLAYIAGGEQAMLKAVENAEDSFEEGEKDLKSASLTPMDCVVGIAASGRTPYVIGALKYAQRVGALAISLACNPESEISRLADFSIEIDVGPEILTGSTRLKSGTAQKLVLNMISTISMIKLGKVFGNLMVDVQITNEKLYDRALRIIETTTGASREDASKVLEESGRSVKLAILMFLLSNSLDEAKIRLAGSGDRVGEALKNSK